jgi:uracil-DNA glycosylase
MWDNYLNNIKKSDYFNNLEAHLTREYKDKTIRPDREDVYKAFELCSFDNLKIVILGKDPYPNKYATGLAFANPEYLTSNISPSLTKIKECVEDTIYKGLNLDFDITLESWAKQGVLLLNTALTVQHGVIGSHQYMWEPFITTVVRIISKYKENVIFMLWGEDAKYYKKFINEDKHHIMEYVHPSYASRNNIKWECNHFLKADLLLKDNKIKW